MYSATLSRVISLEGMSSTVEAGFWPLRMLTPICTARRAMKNGSCEAEAWICGEAGSFNAVSMSGAPSTEVMMIPERCCWRAARSVPMACGSLMAKIASIFG